MLVIYTKYKNQRQDDLAETNDNFCPLDISKTKKNSVSTIGNFWVITETVKYQIFYIKNESEEKYD